MHTHRNGNHNFNHKCFCLKIIHWVHHANRIKDDLRKSSVCLFKNNTCVTTRKHLYDHLCLCLKYDIEHGANIKI